jgi:heme exporter protein C
LEAVNNRLSFAWKFSAAALVSYSMIAGLTSAVPRLFILNETIRNLYFHVPMWFTMIALMAVSLKHSLASLRKPGLASLELDRKAQLAAEVALVFAALGLLTGMIWARFTWGAFWTNDPKLNGTAVAILIYLAYFVLRSSVEDPEKRARLAGTYNVFAFALMIVFIGVLPRMTDSLHPGNGGNPAFGSYDLDSGMRAVFYPAVFGWIGIGLWIVELRVRLSRLTK